MNQILSTENMNNKQNKRENGSSKDIKTVIKFFAIVLVIFGIFLIANSAFALYKSNNKSSTGSSQESANLPEIEVQNKDEKQLIITVMHDAEIKSIKYYWNDEEQDTIYGEGRKYIQTKVEVPKGENELKVIATDINGQTAEFVKKYSLQGAIDINMKQSGNNVKIDVTGNKKIKTIEYTWDEEDVKKIDVNDTKYSFEVDVSLGEHELIVKATDEDDNNEEKKITVTGTTKPTVKIEAGNDCYIIKAHDDVALDRVEIETLADGKVRKLEPDGKDFEYSFPLKEGDDNLIKVTAYNSKGVASKSKKAVWKK